MVRDVSDLKYFVKAENGEITSKLPPTARKYEGYTEVSKELYDSLTNFPYTYKTGSGEELINIEPKQKEPAPSHRPPIGELENEIKRLEAENALLKAQNQALADRTDFHEDVLEEIILTIYS